MDIKKTVGKYKIQGLLGKGSIGSVYLANDEDDNEIALKIMTESPFIEHKVLEHILLNAETTKKMPPHPKITQILEFGKIEDMYYIAMSLVRGSGTLERLISQKELDIDKALLLSLDILEALTHAHKSNIVHGDLKPGNVLINENNEAILNDFGSVTSGPGGSSNFGKSIIGTPKYMSPEQARGSYISQQSDIYSFGVLLFEMITYRLPYELDPGTNMQKMIKLITDGAPMPPNKFNRNISLELNDLIVKLLAKDSDEDDEELEERFEKISDVYDQLKVIVENGNYTQSGTQGFFSKLKRLFC